MSDSLLYRRSSVGSSMPSSGWCLARIPIEPTVVRVETISTSSLKTDPSGVRTSAMNFSLAIGRLPVVLLGGGRHIVDRALEQERRLGDVVVLAVEDLVEAADGLRD